MYAFVLTILITPLVNSSAVYHNKTRFTRDELVSNIYNTVYVNNISHSVSLFGKFCVKASDHQIIVYQNVEPSPFTHILYYTSTEFCHLTVLYQIRRT